MIVTVVANHRDEIKRARSDQALALKKLEHLDGKYWRKLSDDNQELVRSVCLELLRQEDTDRDSPYWVFPNRIINQHNGAKAPTVDLKELRDSIERCEAIINVCDWAETFDQLDEYLDLKRRTEEARRVLDEAAAVKAKDASISRIEAARYPEWSRYFT